MQTPMIAPTGQTFLNELEKKLLTAADRLRSSLNAVVYKHAVLGFIVAENLFAGEELLRWHLPHGSEIALPDAMLRLTSYEQRKYTEQRRVLRMVRGPKHNWRPEMMWGRVGDNLG
jgi:hypothetical protein